MIKIVKDGLLKFNGGRCGCILWDKHHGNHRSRRRGEEGYDIFLDYIARANDMLSSDFVAVMKPEHGSTIECIDNISALREASEEDSFAVIECDGFFTSREDVSLYVAPADCPILIIHGYDFTRHYGALLMLHCGWRPLTDGIISKGIGILRQRGFNLSNFQFFITPAINSCCYIVREEVVDALREISLSKYFAYQKDSHYHVDLYKVIEIALLKEGVSRFCISGFTRCTRCNDRYWSHRAGDQERNAVIASLIPPA